MLYALLLLQIHEKSGIHYVRGKGYRGAIAKGPTYHNGERQV